MNVGSMTTYAQVQPDGSMTSSAEVSRMSIRSVSRQGADGSIETLSEQLKDGNWVFMMKSRMIEYSPQRAAQELQAKAAAEQQRLAAEEQAKAAKQKRGSVLGTLFVAGVGATVNAYGGNSEQILGGALKGAQLANPGNSMTNALGSQRATP